MNNIQVSHIPIQRVNAVQLYAYVCSFCGSRAIVSGPAGGVVGYAMTTYGRETNLPVIGFDMGGEKVMDDGIPVSNLQTHKSFHQDAYCNNI